jgi:cytochrome c-type biogenesis protein CcmH
MAAAGFWVLRAYRREGGGARSGRLAAAGCVVIGLVALASYLMIGRPELPGAPYAARLEALKQRNPETFTADEALAILAEAAKDNPGDPAPHFYSGQLLLTQGRVREAATAFDAALRREPDLPEAMMGLGRALVSLEDGRITPEALSLFERAAELTDDPAPWMWRARAAIEQNREADAREFWREAYRRMPADHPMRDMALRFSRGEAPQGAMQ